MRSIYLSQQDCFQASSHKPAFYYTEFYSSYQRKCLLLTDQAIFREAPCSVKEVICSWNMKEDPNLHEPRYRKGEKQSVGFSTHNLHLFETIGLLSCFKCFLIIHAGAKTMQVDPCSGHHCFNLLQRSKSFAWNPRQKGYLSKCINTYITLLLHAEICRKWGAEFQH